MKIEKEDKDYENRLVKWKMEVIAVSLLTIVVGLALSFQLYNLLI